MPRETSAAPRGDRGRSRAGLSGIVRDFLRPGGRESLRAQLVSQSAQTTLLNLAAVSSGFLTTLVLTRLLGRRGFGTYVNALAWPTLLAIGAQSSHSAAGLRDRR